MQGSSRQTWTRARWVAVRSFGRWSLVDVEPNIFVCSTVVQSLPPPLHHPHPWATRSTERNEHTHTRNDQPVVFSVARGAQGPTAGREAWAGGKPRVASFSAPRKARAFPAQCTVHFASPHSRRRGTCLAWCWQAACSITQSLMTILIYLPVGVRADVLQPVRSDCLYKF